MPLIGSLRYRAEYVIPETPRYFWQACICFRVILLYAFYMQKCTTPSNDEVASIEFILQSHIACATTVEHATFDGFSFLGCILMLK